MTTVESCELSVVEHTVLVAIILLENALDVALKRRNEKHYTSAF